MAEAVLDRAIDAEAGIASRRRLVSRIVIYGLLTIFALIYVIPLFVVIFNSFRTLPEISQNGLHGRALFRGELWEIESSSPLDKGDEIKALAMSENMRVKVERAK